MSEHKNPKVHLEIGEAKTNFEVFQIFLLSPDLTTLAEKLSGVSEIIPEGSITVSGLDISGRNAICIVLLSVHM